MEGEKVRLVPYSREHIPDIYSIVNDEQVMYYFSGGYISKSIEKIEQEYQEEYLTDDTKQIWIISAKTIHKSMNVGKIWLQRINFTHRSAEFGIQINKSNWGKGYGTEAMELLIRYVFDTLAFKRLYCSVLEYNKPAINLYKKLGFKYEGKYRAGAYIGGRYCDMYLYSILRYEWVKKKKRWIPWKDKKKEE